MANPKKTTSNPKITSSQHRSKISNLFIHVVSNTKSYFSSRRIVFVVEWPILKFLLTVFLIRLRNTTKIVGHNNDFQAC